MQKATGMKRPCKTRCKIKALQISLNCMPSIFGNKSSKEEISLLPTYFFHLKYDSSILYESAYYNSNHFYSFDFYSWCLWNEFQVYAGITMAMGLWSCFAGHGFGGRGYVDIF